MIHVRLSKRNSVGVLHAFDRLIDPGFLGYPLRACILTRVEQRSLAAVSSSLADVRAVISVDGLSGDDDLLVHVVARDAEDLYRIAGQTLTSRLRSVSDAVVRGWG